MAESAFKVERSARYVTPEGRISYPSIFEPNIYQGGDPRFQCSILLDKSHPDTAAAIEKLEQLQEDAIAELYGDAVPRNFERWGIIDGDTMGDDALVGLWVVKGANKARPACVDKDKAEILESSELYGGCYGRLNLVGKAYGSKTKGGVTFELLAVQKLGEGAAFGGAAAAIQAAADEF